MTLTVLEYVREDGSSPFRQWFDGLDAAAAAKIAIAVSRLELGNTSNVKWIGAIGEFRINFGLGYRLYLARDGEAVIVLLGGGGTKQRQQAGIDRALALWAEYRARKARARQSMHKG